MDKKTIIMMGIILFLIVIMPEIINITAFAIAKVGLTVPSRLFIPSKPELLEEILYGQKRLDTSEIKSALLNISMRIRYSIFIYPETQELYPGDNLKVNLSIALPDIFINKDVTIVYEIFDEHKVSVYREEEIKTVHSQLDSIKEISIIKDILPGKYILSVSLFYENQILVNEFDSFIVKEKIAPISIMPVKSIKSRLIIAMILFNIISFPIIYLIIKKIGIF